MVCTWSLDALTYFDLHENGSTKLLKLLMLTFTQLKQPCEQRCCTSRGRGVSVAEDRAG